MRARDRQRYDKGMTETRNAEIDPQIAKMMRSIESTYRMLTSRMVEDIAYSTQGTVSREMIGNYIDAPLNVISEAYRLLGQRDDVRLTDETIQFAER